MGNWNTRTPREEEIIPGAILREIHIDGSIPLFGDAVVHKLERDMNHTMYVHLIRPHLFLHESGEIIEGKRWFAIRFDRILDPNHQLKILVDNKGKPLSSLTKDHQVIPELEVI
jgi:hypothetical protein